MMNGKQRRRRVGSWPLTGLVLLFLWAPGSVQAKDLYLNTNLDWMLSIRGGLEYRFHPRVGVRADLGAAVFGLLVADAFLVVYLLPEDSKLYLNLLLGVPNAGTPLVHKAGMVSFGGSVQLGWRFTPTFGAHLRLGAGFPLFFEEDKEMIRDTAMPLDLWPDVSLGMRFDL